MASLLAMLITPWWVRRKIVLEWTAKIWPYGLGLSINLGCLVQLAQDCDLCSLIRSTIYEWDKAAQELLKQWSVPNSLCNLDIPATIRDAMTARRKLWYRYPWVVRLCLAQAMVALQAMIIMRQSSGSLLAYRNGLATIYLKQWAAAKPHLRTKVLAWWY